MQRLYRCSARIDDQSVLMKMRSDHMDVGSAVSAPRDGATKGTALAPSQHIRLTLGRTRTSGSSRMAITAQLLAPLLGATLALSACGTQQAGAAAIIDGTTISDKDVQTVSLQLNSLAQGQQQLTPNIVLVSLILAPYVLAEADRTGKGVADAQARKLIAKLSNPSRPTIDFVRMQLAIPSLTQASKTSILAKVSKAKITVNPRYGTFDVKQAAIVPTSPNWIKASTSSGAK
jgi:hypothetical protein